jgi:hypothetical protein
MAASTITRPTMVDDDGTGTTGTIVNTSWIGTILYDKVDQLLGGAGSYAVLEFGGGIKVDGVADFAGYKETLTDLGAVSAGTVTVNMLLGSVWKMKLTAAAPTTTLSNVPASGRVGSFVMRTEGDGTTRAWAFFDSTVKWSGGSAPVRTITNGKFDWWLFTTVNGGTTWAGFPMGQNMDA